MLKYNLLHLHLPLVLCVMLFFTPKIQIVYAIFYPTVLGKKKKNSHPYSPPKSDAVGDDSLLAVVDTAFADKLSKKSLSKTRQTFSSDNFLHFLLKTSRLSELVGFSSWVVKPFLEQKTYKKVKFVYSDDIESQKIITDIFDMDKLESAFGGRNSVGFDYNRYAERMKEDDKKMSALSTSGPPNINSQEQPLDSILQRSESSIFEAHSEEVLSEASSSSDIPSPEVEDTGKLEKSKVKEHLGCNTSIDAETDCQPNLIQVKESI